MLKDETGQGLVDYALIYEQLQVCLGPCRAFGNANSVSEAGFIQGFQSHFLCFGTGFVIVRSVLLFQTPKNLNPTHLSIIK
jgi:hypothetical protein